MQTFDDARQNLYYKTMLDLQEKLRKSEEERIRLEERFNFLVQDSRVRHQSCINRLRICYVEFLEEQKVRDERNHKLLGSLEKVDSSLAVMSAKTERLNVLRKHYEAYLMRVYGREGAGPRTSRPFKIESHGRRSAYDLPFALIPSKSTEEQDDADVQRFYRLPSSPPASQPRALVPSTRGTWKEPSYPPPKPYGAPAWENPSLPDDSESEQPRKQEEKTTDEAGNSQPTSELPDLDSYIGAIRRLHADNEGYVDREPRATNSGRSDADLLNELMSPGKGYDDYDEQERLGVDGIEDDYDESVDIDSWMPDDRDDREEQQAQETQLRDSIRNRLRTKLESIEEVEPTEDEQQSDHEPASSHRADAQQRDANQPHQRVGDHDENTDKPNEEQREPDESGRVDRHASDDQIEEHLEAPEQWQQPETEEDVVQRHSGNESDQGQQYENLEQQVQKAEDDSVEQNHEVDRAPVEEHRDDSDQQQSVEQRAATDEQYLEEESATTSSGDQPPSESLGDGHQRGGEQRSREGEDNERQPASSEASDRQQQEEEGEGQKQEEEKQREKQAAKPQQQKPQQKLAVGGSKASPRLKARQVVGSAVAQLKKKKLQEDSSSREQRLAANKAVKKKVVRKDPIKSILDSESSESLIERKLSNSESDFDFN
ncbi:protein starmaker-like [Copidosoma floridanum]|uniref:protein starmaker-like n=1 Tax=Copidosoma floridanum TaxID=29053 RepID=UPI0006C9D19D|nr:protein starmaker-like [Copidosoma floridanum]